MQELRIRRLIVGDQDLAKRLFVLMSEVFEEDHEPLTDEYIVRLLEQDHFWAIAAFVGEDIIGGITAHTLPMTRTESSEIFIYDIAVQPDYQRKGIGKQLIRLLCEAAGAVGIHDVFVPADSDDEDALNFYHALGGVPTAVTLFRFSRYGD